MKNSIQKFLKSKPSYFKASANTLCNRLNNLGISCSVDDIIELRKTKWYAQHSMAYKTK